jgi:hypothetical protein
MLSVAAVVNRAHLQATWMQRTCHAAWQADEAVRDEAVREDKTSAFSTCWVMADPLRVFTLYDVTYIGRSCSEQQ